MAFECGKSKADGERYYFIESADQLRALGENTDSLDKNFVMFSDIDLQNQEFEPIGGEYNKYRGTFDGNGYIISNLHINKSGAKGIGLFGWTNNATIKNICLENAYVNARHAVGGLIGHSTFSTIENSYIKNSEIICASDSCGGLIGDVGGKNIISESYSENNIITVKHDHGGGLVGFYGGSIIQNCYSKNNTINANSNAGGVAGAGGEMIINNCYSIGCVCFALTRAQGAIIGLYEQGNITNTYFNGEDNGHGIYKDLSWFKTQEAVDTLNNGTDVWELKDGEIKLKNKYAPPPPPPPPPPPSEDGMRVQVGFSDDDTSSIYIDLGLDLGEFTVDFSTAENAASSITKIDEMLNMLENKQSAIGASYNRMQTIADSNLVSIENYSAANSVIKDADVAKESSNLVKSQILQQASAQLMVQSNQLHANVVLGLLNTL